MNESRCLRDTGAPGGPTLGRRPAVATSYYASQSWIYIGYFTAENNGERADMVDMIDRAAMLPGPEGLPRDTDSPSNFAASQRG